jgi:acyl-coenzyme A thioesterase PaaI-like protein
VQADDLDIPAGYRHWRGDAAEDSIGPFFYRPTELGADTLFRVRPHNCNSGGMAHGGVLMTFADYTLCVAAVAANGEHCVTVSFSSDFVGGVEPGSVVLGRGEVVRRTGSLVFTRGTFEVDGQVVLTASAVVKRIRR